MFAYVRTVLSRLFGRHRARESDTEELGCNTLLLFEGVLGLFYMAVQNTGTGELGLKYHPKDWSDGAAWITPQTISLFTITVNCCRYGSSDVRKISWAKNL